MTKSKLLYSIILLLPLTVFAAEQDNEMGVNAVTVHKNVLCAADKNTKVRMSVQEIDHSITDGQIFEEIKNAKAGGENDGCIIINASRKASTQNVKWAKNNLNDAVKWMAKNMGVTNGTDRTFNADLTPQSLNFAVKVNLTFTFKNGNTYTCKNLVIAQGNSGGTMNNWWIVSNMANDANHRITTFNCNGGYIDFWKFGHMSERAGFLETNRMQVEHY